MELLVGVSVMQTNEAWRGDSLRAALSLLLAFSGCMRCSFCEIPKHEPDNPSALKLHFVIIFSVIVILWRHMNEND